MRKECHKSIQSSCKLKFNLTMKVACNYKRTQCGKTDKNYMTSKEQTTQNKNIATILKTTKQNRKEKTSKYSHRPNEQPLLSRILCLTRNFQSHHKFPSQFNCYNLTWKEKLKTEKTKIHAVVPFTFRSAFLTRKNLANWTHHLSINLSGPAKNYRFLFLI